MTPFIITGLPRSRTAWLANLFTFGPSFCYHDILAEVSELEELPRLARLRADEGFTHVGFADSALPLQASRVMELLPDAKWILVRRPVQDAVESFLQHFTAQRYTFKGERLPAPDRLPTEELFAKLDVDLRNITRSLQRDQVRTIDFEALNWETPVQQLWQFILPEVPWCPHRFRLLDALSINTLPAKRALDITRTWDLLKEAV